jgi:chromosome segregation ATPase
VRKPSAETELRRANKQLSEFNKLVMTLKVELSNYRIRATKAETEAADWRKRFDMLLSKGFQASERAVDLTNKGD